MMKRIKKMMKRRMIKGIREEDDEQTLRARRYAYLYRSQLAK